MNPLEFINQIKDMYNDQDPRPMAQGSRNMAEDGRTPFGYAGIVKQGPRKDMHKYLDFYSKKQAKELGKDTTTEWFKSKPEMDAALKKRKETTGKGLTDAELTKKYKKFLKEEGFKTWAEAPDDAKGRMKTALYNEQNPYESQAKWKEEGLKTRVSEETRELFKKNPPINPKTGLPMTLQEYTALTDGQKTKLLGRLKGKVKTRQWAKRQGWYPEKKENKLMTYLKHAAKKQESLPLKERNFINVWEGEKFVGVKDKRKNTLWTHVDYDITGKKGADVITNHPGHKNVQFFLKEAEKFKYGKPDKLLGSYFSKYKRVPTYSEMYQFFNVDPQSAGAKKGKAYKTNPLQQHHQELMAKEPARNIQLALSKQNTEASRILNQFEKGAKGYSFAEADKKLKKLGVRIKSSKGWMGPKRQEISAAKSIKAAQAETVKLFESAYAKNPKIVQQMTEALKINLKALCPKGQASGGRIGYADGPATVKCGSKRLEQIILRGGAKEGEQELAKKILQAGRGLRGAFSLSGMFGPGAMAFLAGTEAGLVGYDMISQGKTFREAVGNSVFNYALGDRTKIDPAEERYKRYAKQGFDVDKIRAFEKNIDRIDEINLQYDDLYKKANVVNIGGPRRSDAIKQKQQIISDKAIAELPLFTQDLFRTGEIPRLNKFLEKDYVEGMKNISEADRLSEIDRLSNINPLAIGKIREMEDEKRLRELKLQNPDVRAYMGSYPTMYGFASGGRAGYMGGGIAAIRKPHAIPPERQGLRSIMINVNDD